MTPILYAKKIRKTFYHPTKIDLLKNVSLIVNPGESIAIMGASGEGKSTLLQILGTLEAPTSGELMIAGKSVANYPLSILRNRHIGFVFQSFHLLEDYTVLQNILMPPLIGGDPIHKKSVAYEYAYFLMEKMQITHRAEFTTKLLSGGEKQRVALARALCNNPEIVLADEPSGNLDYKTSNRIHEILLDSVKTLQKSLVVVTHDKLLADLCDRTLILCDGNLLETKDI
ncbi:MAG: ABC transporter ATP-binding protein [Chlamydiales bacterium]